MANPSPLETILLFLQPGRRRRRGHGRTHKVCKHINTATNVLINHKKVKPGNYNCDYANVVYLIHCKKCPEPLYIEETGGNFRYRFNNHTHSIRHKKFLPLPLHFNADDHNINDLKVCILKGNFKILNTEN